MDLHPGLVLFCLVLAEFPQAGRFIVADSIENKQVFMQPADKMGHGGVLTWRRCRTRFRHALTGGGLSASLQMPLDVCVQARACVSEAPWVWVTVG